MEEIEKKLRQLTRVKPFDSYKEDSKQRLMAYVNNEKSEFFLTKFLKSIPKPRISLYMKTVVRERVLAFAKRRTLGDYIADLFHSF